MTDADVAWLRTRRPFHALDPSAFPKATPLDGILRHDCRLHRTEPGQVIVREGDYGSSAFLVLTGNVRVFVESLRPEALGRSSGATVRWLDAWKRFVSRSRFAETRTPEQVSVDHAGAADARSIRRVDDREAFFLQDFPGTLDRHQTLSLCPGELFGEVAAMYRCPRAATVVAETEAALLEIRWQGLRILRRDRHFAESLDDHFRSHWLPLYLRELPLLRFLPEPNFDRVVAATQLQSFGTLEWHSDYGRTRKRPVEEQIESEPLVVCEGKLPTELLVVRSGFGRVSARYGHGHRTTAYLSKGHLFGLEELTHNAWRPATEPPVTYRHSLRAVGFLDLLSIPIEIVAADILPFVRRDELPLPTTPNSAASVADAALSADRRKSDRADKQFADDPSSTRDPTEDAGVSFRSTDLLEFIVQHRLCNGRDAMVIDLNRCTRCDDCVRACGAVHDGNPRFVRQGPIHDHLQFVQACMHCSDPVCMIGCPTGAIVRDPVSGVISIQDAICVGCGVCAAACPYENITMTDVVDRGGRPYVDRVSGQPIRKATKCDQCRGLPSGPACVAACPHDAIVRIDLSESPPLEHWLQQRR